MENTDPIPLASSRAQTRDLLSNRDTSSCSGDGVPRSRNEGSSAMRTRNGRVTRFGEVTLPASKSESNRVLMIVAYGDFAPVVQNLSNSRDTKVLSEALWSAQNGEHTIDIADCGTAARFMTTFLACHEGDWLLTGTERMKQRPMAPLVDALRGLGTNIQYVENEGCLPFRIKGNQIKGGKVSIDMTQSSQFASSLLLAAPMWSQGLEMELLGELSSLPYLEMTLAIMRHFGAAIEHKERVIKVFPKPYQSRGFMVGADWSAASYWYEMAALSEECEIRLRGLSLSSHQGDTVIIDWMRQLGVGTFFENDVIVLRKIPFEKCAMHFDFSQHPDLYPTMVATCAGLGIDATYGGLDNLALKESDRVEAMQTELAKLGGKPLHFCAYNDHRVVMALAPFSMLFGALSFDHPEVVEKSYANFWKDASFLPVCG